MLQVTCNAGPGPCQRSGDPLGNGNLGFPETWPEVLQDSPDGNEGAPASCWSLSIWIRAAISWWDFQTEKSHNHHPPDGRN